MDLREALDTLGLTVPTTLDEARTAYRRLVRERHPDLDPAGATTGHRGDRTGAAARLNEAWAVVQVEAQRAPGGRLEPFPPSPDPGRPSLADDTGGADPDRAVDSVAALDRETIAVAAPADLAYVWLAEAASRVGEVAYYDRHLGILEIIVRFEGGPSCSVLMTLQGRALYTEIFCTMESIEAAPTPSLAPVVEALVEELRAVADGG